jgi:DNA-directed RNA polymerase subunit beta'
MEDPAMTQEPSPGPRRLVARLRLASPDQVLRWSCGEVSKADTLHPRSGKPVPGGLFCEDIFGSLVEWRCRCGHRTGESAREQICKRCQTPVLRRRGRRRRMGHVELAAPVAHPWFVKARPSPLAELLDLRPSVVERIVYGQAWIVLESSRPDVRPGQVLEQPPPQDAEDLRAQTGAVALEEALRRLDLPTLASELGQQLAQQGTQAPDTARRQSLLRRLRLVRSLIEGGVRPEWMTLRRLPVVGTALRPMVRLDSGKHASSELNDLYRRVILRNHRLRELLARPTPASILENEQRLLQIAVDALLDNRRCPQPVLGPRQRPLRCLSDLLGGKQGRFRGNLLGKRVDYSARSVIVVGPELKLHEVGLPRSIALRLFEPLLLGQLRREGWATTLRRGRQLLHELAHPERLIELARCIVRELVRQREVLHAQAVVTSSTTDEIVQEARAVLRDGDTPEARWRGRAVLAELSSASVESIGQRLQHEGRASARRWAHEVLLDRQGQLWGLVGRVITGHPVLLNRAPTLHRMGIQAFEPVLVEGNAIRLHPLVCKAFNADFDGDQMAVHLPLSESAVAEAFKRMTPASNLFNPASGLPIITPSQDMVLGCCYLTAVQQPPLDYPAETTADGSPPPVAFDPPVTDHGGNRAFAGIDEVRLAYDLGKVGTHARIRLRLPGTVRAVVDEEDDQQVRPVRPGTLLDTSVGRALFNSLLPSGLPYYNLTLTARRLARILADCHRKFGRQVAVLVLDRLKEAGFAAATWSGASFACDDVPLPRAKSIVLRDTLAHVESLRRGHEEGNVDEQTYALELMAAWDQAHKKITEKLLPDLRQDTRNGRAYLNPLYLMADSGARGSPEQIRQLAGLRGLMASVSGRLIDRPIVASLREGLPSWDYFVSAHGGRKGLTDKGLRTAEAGYLTRKLVDAVQQVVVTMADCLATRGVLKRAPVGALAARVTGRVSQQPVRDSGRVLIDHDELISPGQARRLAEMGRTELRVRSPLTCQAPVGICQRCYGTDLSTGRLVEIGTAVGIVAAQSIGEPGTQLTLRSFHFGGVAGKDIVSDLERVTRFLEVSPVDDAVPLAPFTGVIRIVQYEEEPDTEGWWLDETGLDEITRLGGRDLRVKDGEVVIAGTPLVEGEVDLRHMLHVGGPEMVGDHLLEQVRRIYRQHRLDIDDRHFEVVLSRMLGSVVVRDPGDTDLLPGTLLPRAALRAVNAALPAGKAPARGRAWLLGVSQVAARAEGFLAAASFQRAVKVLTEAALAGRVDRLVGLKENTILGRRIPAGTGLPMRGERSK